MEAVPSITPPQLMSMSSSCLSHNAVFVASFSEGDGAQPYAEPRPVVKQIRFAPDATWPVAETGSYPGESMNTKPFAAIRSAYSYTSTSCVVPPFATAPSDFSRMVVKPPALFPADGLLSLAAPFRWQ